MPNVHLGKILGNIFRKIEFELKLGKTIELILRLGCFGTTSASNPEAEKAVKASRGFASEFLSIFFGLPMWKIHPKLSSPMRRMGKHFDYFTDFSKAQIVEASREVFNSPVSHLNLRLSVAICRN